MRRAFTELSRVGAKQVAVLAGDSRSLQEDSVVSEVVSTVYVLLTTHDTTWQD